MASPCSIKIACGLIDLSAGEIILDFNLMGSKHRVIKIPYFLLVGQMLVWSLAAVCALPFSAF